MLAGFFYLFACVFALPLGLITLWFTMLLFTQNPAFITLLIPILLLPLLSSLKTFILIGILTSVIHYSGMWTCDILSMGPLLFVGAMDIISSRGHTKYFLLFFSLFLCITIFFADMLSSFLILILFIIPLLVFLASEQFSLPMFLTPWQKTWLKAFCIVQGAILIDAIQWSMEGLPIQLDVPRVQMDLNTAQFDVDLVYTFVNNSHPDMDKVEGCNDYNCGTHRWKSGNDLLYSLRSAVTNMPWLRKIHLVTAKGDVPTWLTPKMKEKYKIEVVHHEAIFEDHSLLPTYNSRAIEWNLHRIPGLAERFIYSNDDWSANFIRPSFGLFPRLFFLLLLLCCCFAFIVSCCCCCNFVCFISTNTCYNTCRVAAASRTGSFSGPRQSKIFLFIWMGRTTQWRGWRDVLVSGCP